MRNICVLALLLLMGPVALADTSLTPKEIANGWLLLFDGETTFGWKALDGNLLVKGGALVLTGKGQKASMMPTSRFSSFELTAEYELRGKTPLGAVTLNYGDQGDNSIRLVGGEGSTLRLFVIDDKTADGNDSQTTTSATGKKSVIAAVEIHNGTRKGFCPVLIFETKGQDAKLVLRNVKLRPLHSDEQVKLPTGLEPNKSHVAGLTSVFNGKDLSEWNEITGGKSKFSVTEDGELNIKNGTGDIQTKGQWDDFILQLDIKTNGKHLNSGVFFRARPLEMWSGYESQIRNQWKGDERTNPVDYGTGGIYGHQKARKVVSSDNEWFTKTIIVHGNHIAVWVNGYQVSDVTDERPKSDRARKGTKLGKGPIGLQGHDPTTDLSFRNVRVASLPK